ncbi:MAG: hypothetical protein IKQ82_03710 [Lentisphaeria bacterium]|nr:hypothetical protein [Lentisphaeria bacterium]
MKHILAALTVALAGAATTASAATFYDFYNNVSVSDTESYNRDIGDQYWFPKYYTDTVTYDDFQILRTSSRDAPLGSTAHYRLAITGDNVDIYLTDFIDNVGSPNNVNAIKNKGITQYGYRYLDANGNPVSVDPVKTDLPATPEVIDSVTFKEGTPEEYTVTRNQYKLGTFSKGDVIELYMEVGDNGAAYSYASYNNDVQHDGARGGYGDGTKIIEHTDELMLYYKGNNREAAQKAMPLAALDVPGPGRVYFGIYGQAASGGGTVGSPLPGGNAIYVIAGLFALGFIVARRRKEVAA